MAFFKSFLDKGSLADLLTDGEFRISLDHMLWRLISRIIANKKTLALAQPHVSEMNSCISYPIIDSRLIRAAHHTGFDSDYSKLLFKYLLNTPYNI